MSDDELSYLRAMASGDPKWDLLPNSLAAIQAAIAEIERLREVADQCMRLIRDAGMDASTIKGWMESDAGIKLQKVRDLTAEIERLRKENTILAKKASTSLADNLCPDHRDKQARESCLACEIERLRAERDALARFKKWVHDYLDSKGVPHHPPGPHGAEGCRIGDRMDWLRAERDRLREACEAVLLHNSIMLYYLPDRLRMQLANALNEERTTK